MRRAGRAILRAVQWYWWWNMRIWDAIAYANPWAWFWIICVVFGAEFLIAWTLRGVLR